VVATCDLRLVRLWDCNGQVLHVADSQLQVLLLAGVMEVLRDQLQQLLVLQLLADQLLLLVGGRHSLSLSLSAHP